MTGALFSLLAGVLIAIQGVFNTRVSDKIGLFETTAYVHFAGLILAIVMTLLFGSGNMKSLGAVNKLYLLGGTFGVVVIYSIVKSITLLGAAKSVAIVLVAQLLISMIIDCYGLFGAPKVDFETTKLIGLVVMIAGIFIFNSKG